MVLLRILLRIDLLSIDCQSLTIPGNFVSRHPNNAFNEKCGLIFRISENDNLSPFGNSKSREPGLRERNPNPVDQFIHENMVLDQKGRKHTSRWNNVSLHQTPANS